MLSTKFIVAFFLTALIVVIQIPQTYCSSRVCKPSFCGTSSGNMLNISHPFRLQGDPKNCGDSQYELVCENNVTTLLLLPEDSQGGFNYPQRKYHVEAINYDNFTIRVVDAAAVDDKNNTCSTLSQHSSSYPASSLNGAYDSYMYKMENGSLDIYLTDREPVTVISCPNSVNSSLYVDLTGASNCINGSSDNSRRGRHYYVLVGYFSSEELRIMCKKESGFFTSWPLNVDHGPNLSLSEIQSALLYGFELSWSSFKCATCKHDPCHVGGDIYADCSISSRVCKPSFCGTSSGNILNVSHPFRLQGDPENCGDSQYELVCENNVTTLLLLQEDSQGGSKYTQRKYHVEAINYDNFTIRVVDAAGVHDKNNTCSTLSQLSSSYPPFYGHGGYRSYMFKKMANGSLVRYRIDQEPVTVISCPNSVNSSFYVDLTGASNCINGSSDNSRRGRHYYVLVGYLFSSEELRIMCKKESGFLTSWPLNVDHGHNLSLSEIHSALLYGFELSWSSFKCATCKHDPCHVGGDIYAVCFEDYCEIEFGPFSIPVYHKCGLPERLLNITGKFAWVVHRPIGAYLAAKIVFGVPIAVVFLIIKWRRRHWSMFENIEGYLQGQNNFTPIRYSYSEIKKMAKGFNEKLGEGGYGSVYKGKLRSGILVAIKMLDNTKTNGQEFISEVGTIGRIHHVNVVKLIGYCAERSKRALVYEFMPNGSLDKYLFPREEKVLLSWERKYKIALGVAKGIEYLHRGCDMQILHFDIKPHNILLDEIFIPKVSDFGLARLYPTDNSIVSLTAARGTIGYVAPELINRSIGGISYKADIYSFGMLLMEMVGLKKNFPRSEENSSQYFPNWIYEQFNEGHEIEIGDATDDERKIVKKITLVALWCIQTNPVDRPSMTKVVEMLEGEVELLQLPLDPFQPPQYASIQDQTWTGGSSDSIPLLCDPSDSTTLQIEQLTS